MNHKKILIIDDEVSIIEMITNSFEEISSTHIFYRALNALDGLKIAKSKQPDIILTDWTMPEMDGIELIKQLKNNAETKSIPVVLITGVMTSSENLQTSFAEGAIDFIRKPIDKLELIARVRSILMLAEYHKQTLQSKNQELVNISLEIIRNNEFIMEMQKEIMEMDLTFGTKNKQLNIRLNALKSKFTIATRNDAWTRFNHYYSQNHPNFTQRLSKQFAGITPTELKICALLRMNMTSKDIASLLFLEVESVKSFRYRIRKKLNLDSEDNLVNFLIKI